MCGDRAKTTNAAVSVSTMPLKKAFEPELCQKL